MLISIKCGWEPKITGEKFSAFYGGWEKVNRKRSDGSKSQRNTFLVWGSEDVQYFNQCENTAFMILSMGIHRKSIIQESNILLPAWEICKWCFCRREKVRFVQSFVQTSKNMIFKINPKLGRPRLLRLWLSIIYVWVVHLRHSRLKTLPSPFLLFTAYQPHHHVFSLLPFSCHFSFKLAQILPTEENFLLCFRQFVSSSAEFMAVRVYFSVHVCGWVGIKNLLPSFDEICHLIRLTLTLCNLYKRELIARICQQAYLLNQPYTIEVSLSWRKDSLIKPTFIFIILWISPLFII